MLHLSEPRERVSSFDEVEQMMHDVIDEALQQYLLVKRKGIFDYFEQNDYTTIGLNFYDTKKETEYLIDEHPIDIYFSKRFSRDEAVELICASPKINEPHPVSGKYLLHELVRVKHRGAAQALLKREDLDLTLRDENGLFAFMVAYAGPSGFIDGALGRLLAIHTSKQMPPDSPLLIRMPTQDNDGPILNF